MTTLNIFENRSTKYEIFQSILRTTNVFYGQNETNLMAQNSKFDVKM